MALEDLWNIKINYVEKVWGQSERSWGFHCKGYSYITEVIEEAATVKIDVVSLPLMAYMKHISCYL